MIDWLKRFAANNWRPLLWALIIAASVVVSQLYRVTEFRYGQF